MTEVSVTLTSQAFEDYDVIEAIRGEEQHFLWERHGLRQFQIEWKEPRERKTLLLQLTSDAELHSLRRQVEELRPDEKRSAAPLYVRESAPMPAKETP
jgi:hypothetical protein